MHAGLQNPVISYFKHAKLLWSTGPGYMVRRKQRWRWWKLHMLIILIAKHLTSLGANKDEWQGCCLNKDSKVNKNVNDSSCFLWIDDDELGLPVTGSIQVQNLDHRQNPINQCIAVLLPSLVGLSQSRRHGCGILQAYHLASEPLRPLTFFAVS